MKCLLDENLDPSTARSLDALVSSEGDSFTHLLDHAKPGTPDDEIPPICARLGVTALVTVNVRDFGARKVYFQSLLANDVSVVVLRPGGTVKFFPEKQVAMIAMNLARIRVLLQPAAGAILIRATWSGAQPKDLDELLAEIEGRSLP